MTIPWLTILALLPALGAVVLIFSGVRAAKLVALAVSLITLAFALVIATQFTIGGGMQLVEQVPWIKPLGVLRAWPGRYRPHAGAAGGDHHSGSDHCLVARL